MIEERELLSAGVGKLIQDAGDVPLFGHVVEKVVAEENDPGIPFNIQIVPE